MAAKNVFVYKILEAQSLAADFTSPVTFVRNMDNCSYQINVTTSNSTGSFSVEASIDYAINATTNEVVNAGNWVALPLDGGTPTVSAADESVLIDLNQLPFQAIRLVYTANTAGTGHADIYVMCRRLG